MFGGDVVQAWRDLFLRQQELERRLPPLGGIAPYDPARDPYAHYSDPKYWRSNDYPYANPSLQQGPNARVAFPTVRSNGPPAYDPGPRPTDVRVGPQPYELYSGPPVDTGTPQVAASQSASGGQTVQSAPPVQQSRGGRGRNAEIDPTRRAPNGDPTYIPNTDVIYQQRRDLMSALVSLWQSVTSGSPNNPSFSPMGKPERTPAPGMEQGKYRGGNAGPRRPPPDSYVPTYEVNVPQNVRPATGGQNIQRPAPSYIPASDQVGATNYVQARGFQPMTVDARALGDRLARQAMDPGIPAYAEAPRTRTFDPADPYIQQASRRFEQAYAENPQQFATQNPGPPPAPPMPESQPALNPADYGYSSDWQPIDYGAGLSPYEAPTQPYRMQPAPYSPPQIMGAQDIQRWRPQNIPPLQWGNAWPQLGGY